MTEQRIEYRVVGADGEPTPDGSYRNPPLSIARWDLQRPESAPHRAERRTVTTTPWEKVEE